ncbi:branched-chain amino acid ABC transporter permease [Neobacillus niacini]|uniref:branched-chain amino acid ABC transporter permease n=1 Tax=Neobacillus niacini TaxID=86668 RepID=UPI002FFE1B15
MEELKRGRCDLMGKISNESTIEGIVRVKSSKSPIKFIVYFIIGLIILMLPFIYGSYITYIVSLVGVYYIVSLGLNILTGVAGQLSLGHSGFFAIGAYGTAILTMKAGVPLLFSILISGVVSLLVGAIVGIPSLRVKGLYLAIVTLGLGVIVQKVLLEFTALTEGAAGLLFENIHFFGFNLSNETTVFYFILAFCAVFTYLTYSLLNSHTGRALLTVRDNEIVASSLGISVKYYKILAFCISGFYTAIAGGLYAVLVHHLSPEMFSINMSITFLAMIIVGGLGSIGGSLIGTAFYVLLPEMLRNFKGLEEMIFGFFLLITILFFPKGVWGIVQSIKRTKLFEKLSGN